MSGRAPDLATLRELAGLSQLGLARFSGLPLTLIRALESPDSPALMEHEIERLADALALSGAGERTLRQALARAAASPARRDGLRTRNPERRGRLAR